MGIKSIIKRIIPSRVKEFICRTEYSKYENLRSYSINGEDLLLYSYLKHIKKGFFVDVGAHHPYRFSNTFLFYKLGWTGINIDALPGSMKLFNKHRSNDINLEVGVSNKNEILTYYKFKENAFNTFDKIQADKIKNNGEYFETEINIKTYKLEEILEVNLKNKNIDLLCIDVEGLDLEVLYSNDWNIYKPRFILIEDNNILIESLNNNRTIEFLLNEGYKLETISYNNLLFSLV